MGDVCPDCQAIRNELFIEMKSDSSQYRSTPRMSPQLTPIGLVKPFKFSYYY